MLEPLIVLTVLNCVFMFSSTVTTCALWWQYHHHRCCFKKNTTQQKSDLKRSKGSHTIHATKTSGKSELKNYVNANVANKSNTNTNHEHKNKKCQKKRSKKDATYLVHKNKSEEKMLTLDGTEVKKLEEKTKMSEASQTINDTKSTVVMEFSTIQKVVQVVDNDSDINSMKVPFKDIVQRNKADKNHDLNVHQNFTTNTTTVETS